LVAGKIQKTASLVLFVNKTTVEDEGNYECESDDYNSNQEKESVFVRIYSAYH